MFLAMASLAALAFTVGGIFMKRADGVQHAVPVALFLLIFAFGAIVQSFAMRGAEMGTTYVIVLGLEATFALVFGTVLFGEPVTAVKITAAAMIVGGIALLRAT